MEKIKKKLLKLHNYRNMIVLVNEYNWCRNFIHNRALLHTHMLLSRKVRYVIMWSYKYDTAVYTTRWKPPRIRHELCVCCALDETVHLISKDLMAPRHWLTSKAIRKQIKTTTTHKS